MLNILRDVIFYVKYFVNKYDTNIYLCKIKKYIHIKIPWRVRKSLTE